MKRRWLIELEETPLTDSFDGSQDVIESQEEMIAYLDGWIFTDDPKRREWLRIVSAVTVVES